MVIGESPNGKWLKWENYSKAEDVWGSKNHDSTEWNFFCSLYQIANRAGLRCLNNLYCTNLEGRHRFGLWVYSKVDGEDSIYVEPGISTLIQKDKIAF